MGYILQNEDIPNKNEEITITGFEVRNTPMDTSPLQHGVQNKNVETSPNTDGVSTNQLKEATSQWELAKDMGVTCHTDQAIVIDKIRTMENSDRKEADRETKERLVTKSRHVFRVIF